MGGKNTKAQFAATVVNDRSYGYEHRYDVPLFDDVAPLPTLTPELSRWLARSSARNERVWAVEYGDAKFAESIGEVIALAARFTVVGWLDGELRQFTRFTNDQMLRALGWTDKDRVRRALHAACFQMTRRDGEKGAMMCEVLRERGEKPFLELIKQGVKGQASSYRLVGIEPQARAANCPSAGNGAGTAGAVEPAPTCYARRGPGDEGAPPESPVSGPDSTGQAPPCPPADVPETLSRQSAGECFGERVETGAFQLPVGQPAVPGGAPAPQPAPASQPACSPRPAAAPQPAPTQRPLEQAPQPLRAVAPVGILTAEEEPYYKQMLDAFPQKPGDQDWNTRKAFRARIDAGWDAPSIAAGALKYWSEGFRTPDGRDKWRFPKKWLDDFDHFNAATARPQAADKTPHELAASAKHRRNYDGHGGFWTFTVLTGRGGGNPSLIPIYSPYGRDYTLEEARIALEAQIMRERGYPEEEVGAVLAPLGDGDVDGETPAPLRDGDDDGETPAPLGDGETETEAEEPAPLGGDGAVASVLDGHDAGAGACDQAPRAA